MKKRITTAIMSLLVLSACTRNLDNSDQANITTTGTWRVTLFTERGNDETSDFSGYRFAFNSNRTVTVSKIDVSRTGAWSTNSNKFNIDLGAKTDANKPPGELTDDWRIISTSDNEIKLTDDDATSAEFLTFRKN